MEQHTLSFDDFPDLYDDPADASARPARSWCYRPDVYHRSVDFTDPTRTRFMLHASYKPAQRGMGRLPGVAVQGLLDGMAQLRPAGHAGAVDRVGFPAPGHAFWTDDTLAGAAAVTRISISGPGVRPTSPTR